ncbi:MAG: hypothetical protein NVSMB9_25420 [Isosphaeraceae bacterium]
MGNIDPKSHLSQIETRWSLIFQAHQERGDVSAEAQRELLERYAGAVLSYLLRVTQNPDEAADLAQEFALRFLRGDFQHADPRRGRFRNYVKTAVLNLVIDSHRQRKNRPQRLLDDGKGIRDPSEDLLDLDRQFLDCWRDEILNRAWERLELQQKETGPPFHTVLRFRADHPEMRSHQIAERLTDLLGRPVNANWVRQNLMRARERFVEILQAEVAHSLGNPSEEERDEEMRNLGLWIYVRQEPG